LTHLGAVETLNHEDLDARLAAGPPAHLRFRRNLGPIEVFEQLWSSRHLVWNLGKRELRLRYSQAVLGLAWAILTPFVLMVVFSVFVKHIANPQTHGIPYPIFSYTGLLAWTFFASAVASAANVLISNPLLNKVSAPREVFVLATIGTSGVDALIAASVLGLMFVIYWIPPQPTSVWVPLLLLVLATFTVGVGIFFAALTVYLRDLRHALPLILQVGLFATPVFYGLNAIPVEYRAIYVFINPVAMVIDGLRQTVLYGHAPNMTYLGLSSLSSLIVFVGGYLLFKRLETGFADVS
jgi:ABC-type polysaccharide/polyol phosphate export permease